MGGGGARAKRSSTHVGGRYFVIEAAHVETGKKEREEKRSRVVLDYGEKGRLEISERQRNKGGRGIEKKRKKISLWDCVINLDGWDYMERSKIIKRREKEMSLRPEMRF